MRSLGSSGTNQASSGVEPPQEMIDCEKKIRQVKMELHQLHLSYVGIHIACLGVLWTGVTSTGVVLGLITYFARHVGLVIGYHRYFAHRSFKTSRWFQFVLALHGSLCAERGALWWAQTHRHHHRFSDTPNDIHSPWYQGILYSHSGWFLDPRHRHVDLKRVPDLARFPELVWIDRWAALPLVTYAVAISLAFGLTGFVWGFCVSTVMIWHTTHTIQSISHRLGGVRRYPTNDESRNHWLVGVIALGDGWHNNHHYYPGSARHGFFWWEIDLAWYLLKGLALTGVIWNVKVPPPAIREGLSSGYRQRVLELQKALLDLRCRLDAELDRSASTCSPSEAVLALHAFQAAAGDKIDDLQERSHALLVHGPVQLADAIASARDSLLRLFQTQCSGLLPVSAATELKGALTTQWDGILSPYRFASPTGPGSVSR